MFSFSALGLLIALMFPFAAHADGSNKYQYEHFESQLGYFKTITMGQYADNNDQRIWKWVNDINIFVKGDISTLLSSDLDSLISEINHMISPIQLKRVDSEEHANYFIFLGSAKNYLNFEPNISPEQVESGNAYYIDANSDYEIISGSMYFDLILLKKNLHRKFILRDLLSKSLGTSFESRQYADSVFAAFPFKKLTTKYSNFDKTIISKLYSECVKAGMDKFEVDYALLNEC